MAIGTAFCHGQHVICFDWSCFSTDYLILSSVIIRSQSSTFLFFIATVRLSQPCPIEMRHRAKIYFAILKRGVNIAH